MSWSAAGPALSCTASSPQDHWIVPAPEHERSRRRAVQRQVVRRRAVAEVASRSPGACPARRRTSRSRAGSARPAGSRCRGPRPTRSPGCPLRTSSSPPWRGWRTLVLRQKRRDLNAAGTLIESVARPVDREDRPGKRVLGPAAVGRRAEARVAPRAGPCRRRVGLRRRRASPCSRRACGARWPAPAVLASQRVFQNTSLPLMKTRLMPAARAASTLLRCRPDQYSSWPTERNVLWRRIRFAAAVASRPRSCRRRRSRWPPASGPPGTRR